MRVMCLDISSHAGYAVMQKGSPTHLLSSGTIEPFKGPTELRADGVAYPWNVADAALDMATTIDAVVRTNLPLDAIVIEETNLGKNRYSQKLLEFIHLETIKYLRCLDVPIHYVSSSAWRSTLGLSLSKEDRKNNAKLSKAKRETTGTVDKKALGVKGKVGKKHLAVRYVNEVYPHLNLLMKDNDVADAICLGLAFLKGTRLCDGT